MRVLYFVLVLMLISRGVYAEPIEVTPLVPVPSGSDNIAAVSKGDPAPFDGQLFDQPTAIRWANYLQQAYVRLRMDPMYQYKIDQVEVTALQQELKVERKKYDEVTTDLSMKLVQAQQEAANPPFYKTVWFGVTVGAVVSSLLVISAAVLVSGAQ